MTPAEQAAERVLTGARIRELRTRAGFSAATVAEHIGCSRAHLTNIERGRSRASDDVRKAIAELFEVDVAELERAS